MSEWPYIIASYVLTWVVLGSFATYLVSRNASAHRVLRRGPSGLEP
jgi:hypothetical protein